METRQPRVAVELPVTPDRGKREVTLRFRARAEVREHVAACVALMYLLPDDGLDEAGNVSVEIVPWTLAELLEAIAPMDRAALRAVILDVHPAAPMAVEDAVNRTPHTMKWPAACPSRKDGEPCTVRGAHQWHYGPANDMGMQRMWEDSEADPQDDVPRHPEDPGDRDDAAYTGAPGDPFAAPQPVMNVTRCQHGNFACPLCDADAPDGQVRTLVGTPVDPRGYVALSSERLHGARIGETGATS